MSLDQVPAVDATVDGATGGETVGAALSRYLADNGLAPADYAATHYAIDLTDITGEVWLLPNGPARRRAIPRHDLHHVATGYGTDLLGEAEIGAWELVAGCNSLFLWWINLSAVSLGLFRHPGRVLRAAWRARGQRSLYNDRAAPAALVDLSVGELRRRLHMPAVGQADAPPGRHGSASGAPSTGHARHAWWCPLLRFVSGPVLRACGGVRRPA